MSTYDGQSPLPLVFSTFLFSDGRALLPIDGHFANL